jgi:DNA-binding Xre family transcriptional regulator
VIGVLSACARKSLVDVSSKVDHDGDLVSFGAAVRTCWKDFGLSQEALVNLAEIDRSHMSKIERGERNVTLLNVVRITRALEVRPSVLLLDSGL